jgi:hypothetical protein
MLKKALFLIFVTMLLPFVSACGQTPSKDVEKPVPQSPQTSREIVDKYTHTLATAPDKAEAVSNALSERAASQEKAVE